ncbi:hypothetical protein [Lysobacter gummosus]|uniref:hypothetical protein n=1 Tax=Lysobacter gummosus TaxID=262324 RepID=UPI00363F3C17
MADVEVRLINAARSGQLGAGRTAAQEARLLNVVKPLSAPDSDSPASGRPGRMRRRPATCAAGRAKVSSGGSLH